MNNKDSGCIIVLIILIVFMIKFPDIILVIFAIAVPLLLILMIYLAISNSKTRKEEAEKQHLNELNQEIESTIKKYSTENSMPLRQTIYAQPITAHFNASLINDEIMYCVKQFKESLETCAAEWNTVDEQINNILACKNCQSTEEKYNYLDSKTSELNKLKASSDSYLRIFTQKKIALLNENKDTLFEAKKAFANLLLSKKCICEEYDIKQILCETIPAELFMFKYESSPAILCIDEFYYCLFTNVILVFDKYGIFSAAIDLSAISISVERRTANVYIYNDGLPYHEFVDVDSECLERGNTRTTWRHTCNDGSIDLRYRDNPRIQERIDVYEYGEIIFGIANKKIKFTVSSEAAIKSFEKMKQNYIKKYNHLHNPIPEFLELLKKTTEEGDQDIAAIISINKSNTANKYAGNYFCSIVTDY